MSTPRNSPNPNKEKNRRQRREDIANALKNAKPENTRFVVRPKPQNNTYEVIDTKDDANYLVGVFDSQLRAKKLMEKLNVEAPENKVGVGRYAKWWAR